MSIVRIVRMEFDVDSTSRFDALFAESKSKIEAQKGCLCVRMLHSTSNRNQRTTISWWENEDFLNAYRQSDLFGQVWPQTKALFSEKPIAWSMDWPDGDVLPT